MIAHTSYAVADAMDTTTAAYKSGKRKMEAWHDICRRRRVASEIEKRRRELSAKRTREYQDTLLARQGANAETR